MGPSPSGFILGGQVIACTAIFEPLTKRTVFLIYDLIELPYISKITFLDATLSSPPKIKEDKMVEGFEKNS